MQDIHGRRDNRNESAVKDEKDGRNPKAADQGGQTVQGQNAGAGREKYGRNGKDNRDIRMNRDFNDRRNTRDNRDTRDTRDGRNTRDNRDTRDGRDGRDIRDKWNSGRAREQRDTTGPNSERPIAAAQGREGWPRQGQQQPGGQPVARNISRIKIEETIDDIKLDITRLEKEIALEINEIKSLKLGL